MAFVEIDLDDSGRDAHLLLPRNVHDIERRLCTLKKNWEAYHCREFHTEKC